MADTAEGAVPQLGRLQYAANEGLSLFKAINDTALTPQRRQFIRALELFFREAAEGREYAKRIQKRTDVPGHREDAQFMIEKIKLYRAGIDILHRLHTRKFIPSTDIDGWFLFIKEYLSSSQSKTTLTPTDIEMIATSFETLLETLRRYEAQAQLNGHRS